MGDPNETTQNRSFEIETAISKMLRVGVMLAAAVIVIGLIQFLITGDSGYPGDTYPTSFGAIMSGLLALKSAAIIQTGLLLLILTPVFRVFISLFLFWAEKDYRYVVITAIVFIILILSFVLGKAG
ncbi:DUF1634 domain-containing protein [Paenibacillus barengoltzii]|jgi:uncharacterized membrane protein|uniref:Uncharacterized membrane protein n=1 Tax=Paenibacillus barengoltzii J12 TaxID=935846 RepID=A0ABY1M0X1_9BACL|nr:DUF1634 domain-containing protein [Paenibacillus barengoltzii]SMF36977.1 Uncharacterized membrane protein [Paenibacillus barengoltzii J12]